MCQVLNFQLAWHVLADWCLTGEPNYQWIVMDMTSLKKKKKRFHGVFLWLERLVWLISLLHPFKMHISIKRSMSLYVSLCLSSLLGFISSLPQLAWDKRLCCCCCCCCISIKRSAQYTLTYLSTLLIWFFWGIIILFQNGRVSSMDFHSKDTKYLVTASDDETIRLYDTQDAVWVWIITLSLEFYIWVNTVTIDFFICLIKDAISYILVVQ
jgi:WD40 repeat protein